MVILILSYWIDWMKGSEVVITYESGAITIMTDGKKMWLRSILVERFTHSTSNIVIICYNIVIKGNRYRVVDRSKM